MFFWGSWERLATAITTTSPQTHACLYDRFGLKKGIVCQPGTWFDCQYSDWNICWFDDLALFDSSAKCGSLLPIHQLLRTAV